jgi:putative DNA primase/helicase
VPAGEPAPNSEPATVSQPPALTPAKCALCGAVAARDLGGLLFCDSKLGGCDRQTVTMDGATSERVTTWSPDDGNQLSDGYPPTDIGNARRLILAWGNEFRYVPGWGFVVWAGYRWERDSDGAMLRLAKNSVTRMINEAGSMLKLYRNDGEHKEDVRAAKKLLKWAETSSNDRRIKAAITVSESEPEIVMDSQDFDAYDHLFNAANATIDLETGEARLPELGDYLTKQTKVRWSEDATCPTWEAFLGKIFGNDPVLIAYLQRVVGYAMTGSTIEQCVFLFHGTGANGKSTFLNVVSEVLGEYASRLDANSFLVNKSGVPNDLAKLQNVRFVSAVEVGEGRKLNEVLVKQLSGGDTVSARFLYHEYFEFKPRFKLFFASNHKPEIHGQDHAIWRRIHLIPFEVTIPPNEQDPNLFDKLRAELPGILAWAVRGAVEWSKGRLQVPETVLAATNAYKEEMDIISEFIAALCSTGAGMEASAGDLFHSYSEFCEQSKEKPLSRNAFGRRLTEHGFKGKKGAEGRRIWVGVGLGKFKQREIEPDQQAHL